MSKGRLLYDSFFGSWDIAKLTIRQRLLWIGLLTMADAQGRIYIRPGLVHACVFPFDDLDLREINADLQAMESIDSIIQYQADNHRYAQFVYWWNYQKPRPILPSKYPPPEGWQDREPPTCSWRRMRKEVMERDAWTCQYCGEPAEHIDHIIPRLHGGRDEHDNLVAACATCNCSKGARTPEEAGMMLRRRIAQ